MLPMWNQCPSNKLPSSLVFSLLICCCASVWHGYLYLESYFHCHSSFSLASESISCLKCSMDITFGSWMQLNMMKLLLSIVMLPRSHSLYILVLGFWIFLTAIIFGLCYSYITCLTPPFSQIQETEASPDGNEDQIDICDAEILDELTTHRGELKHRTKSINEERSKEQKQWSNYAHSRSQGTLAQAAWWTSVQMMLEGSTSFCFLFSSRPFIVFID